MTRSALEKAVEFEEARNRRGKRSRIHRPFPPHAEVITHEAEPIERNDGDLDDAVTIRPRGKSKAHRPRPDEVR